MPACLGLQGTGDKAKATATAGPSPPAMPSLVLVPELPVPTCPSRYIPSPSLAPLQGDCDAAWRCLNGHEMEAFREMTFPPAWEAHPPFKEN